MKVGDFGLAPFSPGARAGSIGAWWEYQSPEQHGGRWNEPPPADVFALAVILTEMLSLSALPRAEGRETWWQFIKESRGQARDRLVLLRDDVPRGVWEVIAAAMKQSAKERTPTVQRFQRALRDAWQAAGEWQNSAGMESEPPVPSSLGEASSLVRSAPGGGARAAVIDGWQSAERRREPAAAPRPSMPDPMVTRPSMPDPVVARPAMPAYAPPVNYAPTAPEMAMVAPPNARPVIESTEMIDLARHGAFGRAAADARVQQDSTMALDLASLDPASYGQLGAARSAASLFGESFDGGSDLDPGLGTQVMSQGVGGGTEPPEPFDGVPPPDAANTTRAIDTAEAFAQLDAYARRKPPPEAMATLKAAPRTAGGFNPMAPRNDPSRNPELRATNQMAQVRPATMAPNGFISAAAAVAASGDPFAAGSFAGDPFAAPSTPSSPPVEPTMAVPIEAMMASAHLPYGNTGQAMPVIRPSMPEPMRLPPMNTPFAMGAPPRVSESIPSRAPAPTILGQPAWIMITIAVLIVVSVGASAFLLAGGR